ncbi:MAG TPA: L-2-hydroxyglutarate oxidase [Thermoanaerobaculia bacterium]
MSFDVAVVGGGIVGLATARALVGKRSVIVLEAEDHLAPHQTGHNSGVIHSGLYYKPGSLKACLCTEGRSSLVRYCAERGIPHDVCGKLVLAINTSQLPRLDALEARGRENGLDGLRRLAAAEIVSFEPYARGVAGLHVPQTGIVDYVAVSNAYAYDVETGGGEVLTGARVSAVRRDGDLVLSTGRGEIRAKGLVGCAGLQADRFARLCGVDPGVSIIPFRGEYYEIVPGRRSLVRNLIYPVPDPAFPFLGVHFTRKLGGGVEAGPNAVLAFRREGYTKTSFSLRDTLAIGAAPGFASFAVRHLQMGLGEFRRSFSKRLFVAALRQLVPELASDDVVPAGSGVRAQALDRQGRLVDDFHLVEADRMLHVLNAPSPAATASLAIGRVVAERAEKLFGF